jgi:hypothetical protein
MSVAIRTVRYLRRGMNVALVFVLVGLAHQNTVLAQSVCLPSPRLLTTFPMGAQVGSEVEITVTGEYIEDAGDLRFSDPQIRAVKVVGPDGVHTLGRYLVSIPKDVTPGLVEASVMTRLGLSSSRIFTVSGLREIAQTKGNQKLDTAMPIELNSVCNATMTARAVDFYRFNAVGGQRILVDCAAKGIDSKLNPVVIVADAHGQDLAVERRGGAIDFLVPEDGAYVIKVHDLTFKGGAHYFYRLNLTELGENDQITRHQMTKKVHAFSWPPAGLAGNATTTEVEPNDASRPQKITLPCDLVGSFAKAADTDVFEFNAEKGQTWWVEVASERLGRPTDPTVVVEYVDVSGAEPLITDVAELNDIPSPVKVSSNGYAYDGPPYNAGSSDVLGKFEVKQSGIHRLRIADLFGGTRNDPANVYRLIIRKAKPDFALVAWGLHMQLRNGDRNALSKPIALRGGATMAIEVVAIRRDGFDGEIQLAMDNLPDGVESNGLTIPSGKSRGVLLVTAKEGAPRGVSVANFSGSAIVGEEEITRKCYLASMAWPVPNHWSEVPSPRLLADVLVSVGGDEPTPISITAREDKVFEAKEGEKLTIPLIHMRRGEFSGSIMAAKTLGAGFEGHKFDLPLDQDASDTVLDLATLKTPPGEYLIAFYGGAVAKYQHNPEGVARATEALKVIEAELAATKADAVKIKAALADASTDEKAKLQKTLADLLEKEKRGAARVKAGNARVKSATSAAKAKDIVDIVVSEPIRIRVHPREAK